MKVRAAVLVELNQPLVLMDLEVPKLGPGQVLVKMAYTGICRTQVNEIKGLKGNDPYLPHTLGHEGSGVVLECGEGVEKVRCGDRVIATWIKGKGLEAAQTIYWGGGKRVNSGAISTFMDTAVIAENRLVPIGNDVPLREAALFGCAIPTGAGIVHNELKANKDVSVAVFGVGGVGASAILAAACEGVKQLIAIDREEAKLEFAKRLGATHTIHAKEDVWQSVLALTEGKGVDFAIEAVGNKNTMETAFRVVKDRGGLCVLAGNTPKGVCIECDPFDFIKGKRMVGSWGGGVDPDRDLPIFLKRFFTERIKHFVSHVVPLSQINEALLLMEQQKAARILIECSV